MAGVYNAFNILFTFMVLTNGLECRAGQIESWHAVTDIAEVSILG